MGMFGEFHPAPQITCTGLWTWETEGRWGWVHCMVRAGGHCGPSSLMHGLLLGDLGIFTLFSWSCWHCERDNPLSWEPPWALWELQQRPWSPPTWCQYQPKVSPDIVSLWKPPSGLDQPGSQRWECCWSTEDEPPLGSLVYMSLYREGQTDGVLEPQVSQHPGICCPYKITVCTPNYTNHHLLEKTNMVIVA